jgi:hypothetical protein
MGAYARPVDDRVLLDRYELTGRLGHGGMASVYRATDLLLDREVAVKLFDRGTAVEDARRRGEATALARLSHPHLVALHDAHLAADGDETPSFLVMELVDGEDLRTRLERGPLPADEAVEVAVGIAEALVVVHSTGMVHRDLKPGNILLADPSVPGGRPVVKLADFGIAHLLGSDRITTIGTVIGTAGYLSPEQFLGGEPGPSVDIYALGLVVLEALTGVREYPGTPLEAVAARADHDPRIPASLPEDWRGLLGAMTARDPARRPTAMEVAVMARELAPQLDGWMPDPGAGEVLPAGAAGATGTTRVLPASYAQRRRRGFLTAGAVAGALLIIASTLALGSLMAPAGDKPETVPTTPRPTPSVVAPPATVTPATTPSPGQGTSGTGNPAQPGPAGPGGGGPGKGPGKNNGGGKGHG